MDELLFLAHRIPYPPNKGDKIRSWHILKHLAQNFRVRVGCLIDDPHDQRHVSELARICVDVAAVPIVPWRQQCRALASIRPGRPLSTGYFRSAALARWVDRTLDTSPIAAIFLYSTPMMAYLPRRNSARVILDMVDVDSEKWREMAERSPVPQRWIYAREARTLLAFERQAVAAADHALLSSSAELDLFLGRAPEARGRVSAMGNGVDLDYFSPRHGFARPFGAERPAIVFTGAMDYWPNIDAVQWFAEAVMPRLVDRQPRPVFVIVGSNPAESVRRLASPDIIVTGRVDDVRPYVAHAAAVVAPLRLARGVQNKVLEGMAMGKIVVATKGAAQGIEIEDTGAVLIADDADAIAARVAEVLDGLHGSVSTAARASIESRFGWPASLSALDALFAGSGRTGAAAADWEKVA